MPHVKNLIVCGLAGALAVGICSLAIADDNDIFGAPSAGVEPNILIVFDNSGSMDTTAVRDCHDECENQECLSWDECQAWEEQCYKKRVKRKWVNICQDVCVSRSCNQWKCASWKTVCENKSRMTVAQETIKGIIDRYAADNRFGIMIFHDNTDDNSNGGYFSRYEGKYPVCEVKDCFIRDTSGKLKTGAAYAQAISDYKAYLKSFVDSLAPRTYTPLAETLAEAGLYFAEKPSWFNAGSDDYPVSGRYPDSSVDDYNPVYGHPPIEHRCRKNYIILMTDGEPTRDDAAALKGRYINGDFIAGGDLPDLDDVAGYLHDHDINDNFDTPDYSQNIMVYAIGFQGGDTALLQDTADRGTGAGNNKGVDDGGLYFNATSPEELDRAFETIMFNIGEQRTFFAAPVVPVSHSSKAYAGDYVYMSLFQPSGESRWIGNLKKYVLNGDNVFASCDTRMPILDDDNLIRDNARSCWSETADGGAVDKGGAGEKLAGRTDSTRRIYSNITAAPDLTLPANSFSKGNGGLVAEDFGVTDKDALIDQVRLANEKWRLGDINHSRPVIADYIFDGDTASFIFVGSNDGMLHCFNDIDGQENWAFIPREQFGRLKDLLSGGHVYYMDGSPTVADTDARRKIVVCGERRGGCRYYGIDISAIDRPLYLYTHTTDGQSWKTPQFMTVAVKDEDPDEVFLVTGGYDPSLDQDRPAERGRSVYTIDAVTGEKKGFSADITDFEDMSCVVSACGLDMIDDANFLVNKIYAADLNGHIYAFKDNDNPDDPVALDGDWQKMHLFSVVSGGRKIFEDVDVVSEMIWLFNADKGRWERVSGEYVYFGTGDRANPLRTDQADWFYCIKNDWRTGPMTVTTVVGDYPTLDDDPGQDLDGNDNDPVIVDVSDNKIQDGTIEEQNAVRTALGKAYNRGWCIALADFGEKCLSTPIVYDGVVYFTTYTPPSGISEDRADDPCSNNDPAAGVSRLYALDYKTGGAVYDFSDDDKLDKEDRSRQILEGLVSIAPSPKIVITDRGPKLLIGPYAEDPISEQVGVRKFYWKID